jgi:hypothetical protein
LHGPPDLGDPTVLAHAYRSVPAPTTHIVPIVIEPINQGPYGHRTKATIPKIAGGAGVPVSSHFKIGKKWTYRGRHHSYVNARCETGKLEAEGDFTFADETGLSGIFIKTLHGALRPTRPMTSGEPPRAPSARRASRPDTTSLSATYVGFRPTSAQAISTGHDLPYVTN